MPEDTSTNAAFEEVLQLSIDTEGFSKQMDQVAEIYKAAINKMPDIDKVSGVAFSESITKLTETIEQLSAGAGEALGDISATMIETADTIEQQMGKAATAVQESQAKIVEALTGMREQLDKTKSSGSFVGDFFDSFTSQIGKTAGSLLKSVLIYDSFNKILEATSAAIMAPFKALGEGFTYLQNVQERGSEIKAALLQSVQYSANWGDNVKIAGQQADILVRKVDDLATKLKVSSQSVQTGFTSFLEYGGRNLTGSVDDALKVSGLVTGALQTQTPNIESRKLIAEMQKLAQGATSDSDKLAASLGLSKDQLKQMVDHAQKYHDLYQEILAFAPGIADRISEANDRQTSLVATLELYKERWEALVAGPIFQQFTKILQDILGWVDANGAKLNDIGINLGIALGNAAEAGERFIKGNWSGLKTDLLEIASTFLLIATAIGGIVNMTASMALEANALGNSIGKSQQSGDAQDFASIEGLGAKILPDNYGGNYLRDKQKRDLTLASSYQKGSQDDSNQEHNIAQTESNINQILDKLTVGLAKLATGDTSGLTSLTQHHEAPSTAEAPNTPLNNLHPKNGNGNNAALRASQQELRDEITKTKNAYQDERDSIQDDLAKNVINHQTAAEQIKSLYQQEIKDIDDTMAAYKKKATASGANSDKIKATLAFMQNERDTLAGQSSKATNAAQKAADAEVESVKKAHLAALVQMDLEHQKEHLAVIKQGASDGLLTQTQAFDAETAVIQSEYNVRHSDMANEVNQYADGTSAKEAAIAKMNLADAQYTAEVQLRSQQRIDIVRKEQQSQFEHTQTMGKAGITQQSTIHSASDITSSRDKYAQDQKQLLLETKLTEAAIANTAALLAEAEAKNVNSDESRKLQEQLVNLENTRLQQFAQRVKQGGASAGSNTGLQQVQQKSTADTEIAKTQAQASVLAEAIQKLTDKSLSEGMGSSSSSSDVANLATLKTQLDSTNASLTAMQKISDSLGLSFGKASQSLENSLLGPSFDTNWQKSMSDWGKATDATGKLTAGAEAAADGLSALDSIGSAITGAINQYSQGQKQGGVLGGVGSLLATGPVSSALSMIPVVGSIVKPLGDAFSFIGDMFVAQAKKIADSINKSITDINNAYSVGTTTLSQTIAALQQQRQDAITQLSGVKGGQSQLNTLLPTLDQEIASLQKQAADAMKSFEDSVTVLQSGGTELQNWTKTWMDINKQVQDYLAAGGSIATANQFLNDTLAAQTKDVLDNLNSGEQQAIQDAISLNNLLQQRIDLQRQEAETEFGITTQSALERRTSTGVQVASQLADQKYQYNEQLDDLNNQITLAQQKVALESQVFDIATDTATLQQQSNDLTLYSLQEQLSLYQQMQQIIQSTAGLTFTGSSFNPTVPGTGNSGATAISGTLAPINLTVNVDAGTQDVNSQQFSTYLASAIQSQVSANRTTV